MRCLPLPPRIEMRDIRGRGSVIQEYHMPSFVIQDRGSSIIRAVRHNDFAPQAPGKLIAIH